MKRLRNAKRGPGSLKRMVRRQDREHKHAEKNRPTRLQPAETRRCDELGKCSAHRPETPNAGTRATRTNNNGTTGRMAQTALPRPEPMSERWHTLLTPNNKVSYHADNAGGAHEKDTNDK